MDDPFTVTSVDAGNRRYVPSNGKELGRAGIGLAVSGSGR